MRPNKDTLADLKRALKRLALLDAPAIPCLEGPVLARVLELRSPAALLDDVEARGGLSGEALARCARLEGAPMRVEPRLLAKAQRDLRVLATSAAARKLIADSPRALRRHGTLDAAWLAGRQQRIDELSALLHRPAGTVGPLQVVELLRGPEAGAAVSRWRARSIQWGRLQREAATRRLSELEAGVAGSPAPRSDLPRDVAAAFLAELLPRASRAGGGRARDKLVHRVVAALVAWPEQAASHGDMTPAALPASLPEAIRAAGAPLLERLPSTRHAPYVAKLDRALALLALRHGPDPEGRLTPGDVALVLRELSSPKPGSTTSLLPMGPGLELLRLQLQERDLTVVELLVAAGLELPLVARLSREKQLDGLQELAYDVEAARAWARWVLDLAPRLRASGVELKLPTSAFRTRTPGGDRELALFAQAMLAGKPDPGAPAAARLSRLDAVLALVQGAPAQARSLRAELAGTDPGAGRRLLPELAEWLGDDETLDRFCHLSSLAGERPALPRALRRDFLLVEKLLRERAHLAALPAPTAVQQARLGKVEARLASGELPSPDWTRRHLRERLEPALGRALEARLDAALREALRDGFGIEPPALTPAWRDAIRFYLSTTQNRPLLGTLLRHAAAQPGAPIVRTLPVNRAWMEEAANRFDVEAWLSPRKVTLLLGGQPYTLATEEDPLEVLRMGIPFDTCLSLAEGCNAASTVLNALDANKRVLYLRDAQGTIVARKLLALAEDDRILGYRLYFSLATEHRPMVEQAVSELCLAMATETRLPLAGSGKAASIHQGFWYDDGVVAFEAPAVAGKGAAAELCLSLGRPPITSPSLDLEARLWKARREGEVEAVAREVTQWSKRPFELVAEDWLIDRLGEAEVLRRCEANPGLASALLRRSFHRSPARMLALLGRLDSVPYRVWETASGLLSRVPDATGLVRRLADVARLQCGRTESFDDHGIEHGTLWELPRLAERAPIAEVLDAIDRLAPVWAHVLRESADCSHCLAVNLDRLGVSCELSYARAPDPTAIVRCLSDPGSSAGALCVALHLAAVFPLPRSARESVEPPWGLTAYEGVPGGCPAALRALRSLRDRHPGLARTEEYVAAMLRQAGPGGELLRPGEPPAPASAPFEALADLAMHLPEVVARVLEPWGEVGSPRPGRWELFHHRRHQTPWRRRLLRRGAGTAGETRAWAALLGEADPGLELPAGRDFAAWHPDVSVSEAPRLAALVRRQLALELELETEGLPVLAVDPALVRHRLLRVGEASLAPGHHGLGEALLALVRLELPPGLWRAITWQLLDRGAGGALEGVLGAWLPRCTEGLPELPPELALRLGVIPELRELVVETLGRLESEAWGAWFERLVAADAPAGSEREGFLDALMAKWCGSKVEPWACFGPGLLQRLTDAVLAAGPGPAVQLYETLGSAVEASGLLDRMVASFGSAGLSPHLAPEPESEADLAGRRRWLAAALEVEGSIAARGSRLAARAEAEP